MKFSIDTEKKTISVDGDVNIGELVDWLKTHFKGSWKEFKLETTTNYQPSYPVWVDGTVTVPNVIINPTPYPVPAYPWQGPYCVSVGDVTWGATSTDWIVVDIKEKGSSLRDTIVYKDGVRSN